MSFLGLKKDTSDVEIFFPARNPQLKFFPSVAAAAVVVVVAVVAVVVVVDAADVVAFAVAVAAAAAAGKWSTMQTNVF